MSRLATAGGSAVKGSPSRRFNAKRDGQLMNKNASEIGGLLDTVRSQLEDLAKEVKTDEEGLKDFERQLGLLRKERELVERRYAGNKQWIDKFDEQMGPFTRNYGELTDGIGTLYDNAKKEHKKGLLVLMEEFNYHPIFKHPGDTFYGVPFNPK